MSVSRCGDPWWSSWWGRCCGVV